MRGIWTRERIALLKRLWTDGETATAIAARLRMSKSAGARQGVPPAASPGGKRDGSGGAQQHGGPQAASQKPAADQTSGETGRTGRTGRTDDGVGENVV